MCQATTKLPDGPKLSPAETSFEWFAHPFTFLDQCTAQHGDTFTLRFSRLGTHVVVSHPDDVRSLFTADRSVLHAGKGNALLEPILGRNSLLVADGERHSVQRALLQPPFRNDRIEPFARAVAAATRRRISNWTTGRPIAVLEEVLAISREVILDIVLSPDDESRQQLSEHIEKLMQLVATNVFFGDEALDPRLKQRFARVRGGLADALQARIEARRHSGTRQDDVLGALLHGRDAQGVLSDEEICDHLITIVMAGHETTASAVAWTLRAVAESPAAERRLLAEIESGADSVADDHLGDLPYLQAVCLESLRLWPVIPVVSREVRRPFTLRAQTVPAGIFVTACAYVAHRRADSFDQPQAFQPERFLGRQMSPYVYFPFGGGAHRCLGMSFALTEMEIIVGMLVRRFHLRVQSEVRAVRRAVTVVPSGGGKMWLEPRAA